MQQKPGSEQEQKTGPKKRLGNTLSSYPALSLLIIMYAVAVWWKLTLKDNSILDPAGGLAFLFACTSLAVFVFAVWAGGLFIISACYIFLMTNGFISS